MSDLDVTGALKKQKYDAVRITQSAESFYVSLGFPKLPQTFWERSLLTKPRDRDVQCHASAWHMDGKDDVRIKQCIEPTRFPVFGERPPKIEHGRTVGRGLRFTASPSRRRSSAAP